MKVLCITRFHTLWHISIHISFSEIASSATPFSGHQLLMVTSSDDANFQYSCLSIEIETYIMGQTCQLHTHIQAHVALHDMHTLIGLNWKTFIGVVRKTFSFNINKWKVLSLLYSYNRIQKFSPTKKILEHVNFFSILNFSSAFMELYIHIVIFHIYCINKDDNKHNLQNIKIWWIILRNFSLLRYSTHTHT